MIEEAYCSYEISKLLKEKGFDECIFEFYEGDRIKYAHNGEGFRLSELPDIYYPHITHQMACAWLREVHNMHIDIDPSEGDWHPCVIELETWSAISDGNLGICDTYEDAVEAALKYALENLI